MKATATGRSEVATALRLEFDRSFAAAPLPHTVHFETLLAVRIGGDAYAIPVAQIAGLHVDRRIVPFPTTTPELLGLASFRGQVAPVYGFANLLGYPTTPATPRWLVLARRSPAIALAFDAFERQFLMPQEEIASSADGNVDPSRPFLRGAVRADETLRPIVHIAAVLDAIEGRVRATRPAIQLAKER